MLSTMMKMHKEHLKDFKKSGSRVAFKAMLTIEENLFRLSKLGLKEDIFAICRSLGSLRRSASLDRFRGILK